MLRSYYFALGALLASAVVVPVASGDIITPAGLAKDAKFRVVFVTSGKINATSPNAGNYDAFVQSAATTAGLNTYDNKAVTWQAIVSTWGGTAASARLPLDSVPWYIMDAAGASYKVSTGSSYNSLLHAINLDEQGLPQNDVLVWTGTWADGTGGGTNSLGSAHDGHFDWYSAFATKSGRTTDWLRDMTLFPTQATPLQLFGVSQVLSAVPEPGCLTLWAVALGVGGGYGIWRRKKRIARAEM